MSSGLRNGLGLVLFGMLLAFVGSVWTFNLFGVATEHARRIRESGFNQDLVRLFRPGKDPKEVLGAKGSAIGRFTFGVGMMLFGIVLIVFGVTTALSGG